MPKNFSGISAFVIKVVHKITRWEDLDGQEVAGRQRVGDSVNSLHNNKLAMLYSGNDNYNLFQKFLTCQQDHETPSVMEQLQQLKEVGVLMLSPSNNCKRDSLDCKRGACIDAQ